MGMQVVLEFSVFPSYLLVTNSDDDGQKMRGCLMRHSLAQSFSQSFSVLYSCTDTVQCTTGTGKTGAISRPASRHVTGVARNSGVPGMLRTNQACSKACSSSAAALCDQITAARRQRLRYGTVKMVLRFKQPCQQPRDTSPGSHVTPVFLACCAQTKHAARPARAQLPRCVTRLRQREGSG